MHKLKFHWVHTRHICLTSFTHVVVVLFQVAGPRLMENRKPFELRKVLIVYNFLQVLFSTWLFYEACVTGWFNGYSLTCQPVDYSRSPTALRVINDRFVYVLSHTHMLYLI